MRLPLPGLADVRSGTAAVHDRVTVALELVPRAAAALTRVEELLDRVDAVVSRAEQTAGSAGDAVGRGHQTLDVAELVARDAGRAVEGATGVLDRVDTLLVRWETVLRQLAPAAERFAESLDPDEVRAAISLVDRLPAVLDHVENDVLPMLQTLDRVGPDLHELLGVVEDLRRVVTGLPGVSLLRRRGDEEPQRVEDGGTGRGPGQSRPE